MKFKLRWLMVLLIGMLFLASCQGTLPTEESFPELIAKVNSYQVSGKLYSMFPTGTKECLITVYYKTPDLYRVEIDNSSSGDKQILLKNPDGVHVLIPSINKSFRIKSGWPINSSYPYLLQSLSKDIIADDNPLITKNEVSTTIEVEVKLFENAAGATQKIIFNNKTNLPEEVLIYDQNKNLLSRFVYEEIKINESIDDEIFNTNQTVATIRSIYQDLVINREITYPTYFPVNATLVEERITGSTNDKCVIMKFNGDVSYTIVEEFISDQDTLQTVFLEGDILVIGQVVYIVTSNTVSFYNSGIEYIIASNDLDILEMIKIGDSLLLDDEK